MKLGRLPRAFDPRIPHWSALKMGAHPIVTPETCDYAHKLPGELGMMLNDQLGDCAEAAYGHALQTWSINSGKPELTEPNSAIEALYETQGYQPSHPSTDHGTVLQSLLTRLLNGPLPAGVPQLAAFIEIDPTNDTDVDRAIYECGLVYVGLNIPHYFNTWVTHGVLPETWATDPWGDSTIVGGHCVIAVGYGSNKRRIVSWGSPDYWMTANFWRTYVEECYALVSLEWIEATGRTPLGLTVEQLAQQMEAIKS